VATVSSAAEKLLVPKKVASEVLSVSLRTVQRMLADGDLPYVMIRGAVRIPVSALRSIAEAELKQLVK
jgi:excisionase family DNA binding protein